MDTATITTLLTDPAAFYEERGPEPSLKGPALVVTTIALLAVVSSIVTVAQFSSALPSNVRIFALVGAIIGAGFAAVGPYISWLLYTIAFTVITYFFDGEGEFRDLFALVGWGFAPRIVAAVVSLVATAIAVQGIQPPADPSGFTTFSRRLQQSMLVQGSSILGIVFTLWSAYIWVPAVQQARDVTRRQAIISVAIPVALSLLLALAGLAMNAIA